MTQRNPWILRTVAVGVSLTATVVLLELGLHLIDVPRVKTNHQRLFVEYDEQRGWRNIPNAAGDYKNVEYTVHLQYNARGIRGPERPYAKPPGTYRIVVLGDSYIDGYSVAREDRVTEQLERLLNTAQSARSVEVIALGTAGYSTDQELLWLESEGLRYEPDLVVLMFYFNDIWYNAQSQYWRGAKPLFVLDGEMLRVTNIPVPRLGKNSQTHKNGARAAVSQSFVTKVKTWGRTHSKLYALSVQALHNTPWLYGAAIRAGLTSPPPEEEMVEGAIAPLPQELTVYQKNLTPEVTHAWHLTSALLRHMHQVVEAANAQFVAFHIPFRATLYSADWEALRARYGLAVADWDLQQVARQFLASCRAPVQCIEPTARFKEQAEIQQQKGERLYYQYDNHWNANGHALAAEILADYVLSHWLPRER